MSAPNEIDYGIRPEDSRVGHRAALGLTAVFLLVISLPGALREFSADAIRGALTQIGHWQDGKVVDRLRAVEKRVDDGAWTKPIRRQVQTVLYQVFREGNRKVLVGRDGWLFHRPGIRALTGRGPVLGPTHSVAKDHTLKSWEGPIPVIKEFAAQLEERGIKLVLVPVSDKAHTSPRHVLFPLAKKLTEFGYAMSREEFIPLSQLGLLRSRNPVLRKVADLQGALGAYTQEIWGLGSPTKGFGVDLIPHPNTFSLTQLLGEEVSIIGTDHSVSHLEQDTHWKQTSASYIALEVGKAVLFHTDWGRQAGSDGRDSKSQRATSIGDLAGMLGLGAETLVVSVAEGRSTTPALSDPTSPIVLLGDSNVNMYDDPSLPFYMPGAGFGSWLSAYVGKPLHTIAINGGGATAVRQRFAALPDDVVRAKKVVVWVIAERDLFMDPAVARENGVEWKRVVFNPMSSQLAEAMPGDALVVDVTLKTKSALQDLGQANYPDAVYVAECAVEKVVAGNYAPSELAVVLWNFRHREVQPSARYAPGQKLRLTLVPWDRKGELTKINMSDDVQRFDLPLLYAEKAEPRQDRP